jgi:hypothetical protein
MSNKFVTTEIENKAQELIEKYSLEGAIKQAQQVIFFAEENPLPIAENKLKVWNKTLTYLLSKQNDRNK